MHLPPKVACNSSILEMAFVYCFSPPTTIFQCLGSPGLHDECMQGLIKCRQSSHRHDSACLFERCYNLEFVTHYQKIAGLKKFHINRKYLYFGNLSIILPHQVLDTNNEC